MPDLTTTVPGVAFVPPPDAHIGPILAAINRAVADLSPGSKGALVSVVTRTGRMRRLSRSWERNGSFRLLSAKRGVALLSTAPP
jgi:hypothetical protein